MNPSKKGGKKRGFFFKIELHLIRATVISEKRLRNFRGSLVFCTVFHVLLQGLEQLPAQTWTAV